MARFEDGTEAAGDLLIGADGIHSRTRRIIDPTARAPLHRSGQRRWIYPQRFGRHQTGHLHDGLRQARVLRLHGQPLGEIWWFANPPSARELTRSELVASTEEWKRRLIDLFVDDATPAVEIIRATAGELAGTNQYDMPSVPTWHRGPMVIVGDAAHATSPSSGQGASMAIEDAVVLAKCLRDLPDVSRAFAAYEQLRRERVERVVAQGARSRRQSRRAHRQGAA